MAYLDILYSFFWAFLIFSLLLIPTIQAFKSGTAYVNNVHAGFANTMISNLGYSDVECHSIPVSLGNLVVSCNYGTVGKILDYGVNNEDSGSPLDACSNNDYNRSCKPNSGRISDILSQAVGMKSYNVRFELGDFYQGGEASKTCSDPTNLFFVQHTCVQSPEELATKYESVNFASATVCLISLLFLLLL